MSLLFSSFKIFGLSVIESIELTLCITKNHYHLLTFQCNGLCAICETQSLKHCSHAFQTWNCKSFQLKGQSFSDRIVHRYLLDKAKWNHVIQRKYYNLVFFPLMSFVVENFAFKGCWVPSFWLPLHSFEMQLLFNEMLLRYPIFTAALWCTVKCCS